MKWLRLQNSLVLDGNTQIYGASCWYQIRRQNAGPEPQAGLIFKRQPFRVSEAASEMQLHGPTWDVTWESSRKDLKIIQILMDSKHAELSSF